jgi:hypothetical protein
MSENDETEERLTRAEIILEDLLKNKFRVARALEATGQIMTDHEFRIAEFDREMQESREKFDREMQESREKFDREMQKSREDFEYRLNSLIDVQMSRDAAFLKMKNEVTELCEKVEKIDNSKN